MKRSLKPSWRNHTWTMATICVGLMGASGCQHVFAIEHEASLAALPDAALPEVKAAPTDLDRDGLTDDIDRCPAMVDKSNHDEDEDGLGDACDNCIGLPNRDQADRDLDGVGDACDPRPATAGDCMLQAFFVGGPTPDYVAAAGWQLEADAVSWNGSAGPLKILALRLPRPLAEVTVETAVEPLGYPEAGLAVAAGAFVDAINASPGWRCGLWSTPSNGRLGCQLGSRMVTDEAETFVPNKVRRIYLTRSASEDGSEIVMGTRPSGVGIADGQADYQTSAQLGLFVEGLVRVRFPYMVVYARSGALGCGQP